MSTPEFDITPHTQMWQKFMRCAGFGTIFVAIIVIIAVKVATR
jgi:hypothetical protein